MCTRSGKSYKPIGTALSMSEAEEGVPQVNVAELIKVLVEDRHR